MSGYTADEAARTIAQGESVVGDGLVRAKGYGVSDRRIALEIVKLVFVSGLFLFELGSLSYRNRSTNVGSHFSSGGKAYQGEPVKE